MSWYYLQDREQIGPIPDPEFESLVNQGAITASTYVWQEGMAEWQPFGRVAASGQTTTVATLEPAAAIAGIPCSRCGRSFRADELIRIAGTSVCPACKPMVLQSLQEGVPILHEAESVRKAHISHEASVKSIAVLYFLASVLLIFGGIGILAMSGRNSGSARQDAVPVTIMGVVFVILAVIQICTAVGLRKLSPWSRIAAGVLSGIGLLGFPLGTLINGYILYLLFSKKGVMVFSEPYKRVIETTPHIKHKTSVIVWILLALVVALIVLASASVFFSPHK